MRAEEVYNLHKGKIKRIADKMRFSDAVTQEKVLDKNGNIDILFSGSKEPAPDAYEALNRITYELRGIHTHCRVMPILSRDIRMVCTEIDKTDALNLEKCLEPIRKQVSEDLARFGREMIGFMEQTKSRKERREAVKEAGKSGIYTPLLDIVEYFDNYKKEHCKPVKTARSEIEVKGSKIEYNYDKIHKMFI